MLTTMMIRGWQEGRPRATDDTQPGKDETNQEKEAKGKKRRGIAMLK